jgi:SAM-dependent methyltransferase
MTLQFAKALRRPGKALDVLRYKIEAALFWDARAAAIRPPRMEGPLVITDEQFQVIEANLAAAGVEVRPFAIDVEDCRRWLDAARYDRFPAYLGGGKAPAWHEKSLEHYLAAKFLALGDQDVYIDVGNYESPAARIYRDLYNCRTYRQDLAFPEGLRGDTIGGDAGNLPLPDGFATKMALHCAFEHFEGDSDSRFIREAARVLRPGGRVCIVPLYLAPRYIVDTDPVLSAGRNVPFEDDAVVCCVRNYRNRHGRRYDPAHFLERIVKRLDGLGLSLYVIHNARDVHPTCYVRHLALFEK